MGASPAGWCPTGSDALARSLREFAKPANPLASALTSFGCHVDWFVGALEKFPESVSTEGRLGSTQSPSTGRKQ